jgi:hypothetical protein
MKKMGIFSKQSSSRTVVRSKRPTGRRVTLLTILQDQIKHVFSFLCDVEIWETTQPHRNLRSTLEGESTDEKWTIFLGYQGTFIMVLPSAARLDRLLLRIFFSIV